MTTIKVRYSVTFEATIQVSDRASPEEIGEELENLTIPENEISRYVEDTFEPETDENGHPTAYAM